MIAHRTVLCLGVSQLICWGITYYLVGGFGEQIAAEFGWSRALVYGGFSAALLVMGLTSPLTGRLIDQYGGRVVMVAGSILSAIGCAALALAQNVTVYYAAWLVLGLAMRLVLYDAAFATLARIGGPGAGRAMAQITLLGGLASTFFWPFGHLLAEWFGWRGALLVYVGIALLTVPLHLMIPMGRFDDGPANASPTETAVPTDRPPTQFLAGFLYALIATLTNFLNSGMSAHMIGLLTGLGVAASVSVWIATLRGFGQSSARLGEVLFGRGVNPLTLNLFAVAMLPICFIAGLLSGQFPIAAMAFAFLYGVGNGLATITRGTMALVLFDHRTYGTVTGRLLVPSFILAAVAPLAYAFMVDSWGEAGALNVSSAIAAIILAASLWLKLKFGGTGSGEKRAQH